MTATTSAAPFIPGILLGEIPARGAQDLTPHQRQTLLKARKPLTWRGRLGWFAPDHPVGCLDVTVRSLAALGLITIARHSKSKSTARLTERGAWYARTLAAEQAQQLFQSTPATNRRP